MDTGTYRVVTDGERFPTRDILMALDQLAHYRTTLEEINQNVERMIADNFMCQKQAD